jgi:hypothetical protein
MATYVDNAVQFGSFSVTLTRAGSSLGTYIVENITITRPSKKIERPNHIGEPNGFVLVDGFVTASGTIQVPTAGSDYPARGDYFEEDFGFGTERFVISEVGQPFSMSDYHKCNISMSLSPNPPS